MELKIYTADCTGNKENCLYPNEAVVTDAKGLAEAVAKDHVLASYKGSYRSNSNFLESWVTGHDCDNDHSEDPDEWMTLEKFDEMLPDVSYALIPSRHHMLPKGGKSARPRYHFLAPISKCTDGEAYSALKNAVQRQFPVFDDGAKDAARFFFGSGVSEEDIVWHEGWMNIDEVVDADDTDDEETDYSGGVIREGSRNNTMSRFAAKVLKKYGNTDTAHKAFLLNSKRCDPPLDDGELDTIWGSAVKFFNKKIASDPDYVPSDKYNADFENASLRPDVFSDLGEAKVLAREFGDELAYADGTDFIRYDGTRWVESRQKSLGAVEEFMDMQFAEASEGFSIAKQNLVDAGIPAAVVASGGKALEKLIVGKTLEKLYVVYQKAKAYFAFAVKYQNMTNMANMQKAVKPMLEIDIERLDADENLLNTPGGTYDLKKGLAGVREHDPDDMITRITKYSPDMEGKDYWEDALKLFFCGDADLIRYVQMTCGLAAIGKVYEEALIIAYGEGRNGKSTFWNTIKKVLGTYSGTISADTMTSTAKRNVKPEIAELKGKRLVIAAELEEGDYLSTSILKQVCSTDPVRGEKKYKDPFDYEPTHTVVLYTNHLPKVRASDEGTWRRLIVIPFNAVIEGTADVKNYSDFLAEHAGGYVLAWIIEGAKMAIEADYHIPKPKVVEDAVAEYREMNDWLGHFLEECCEKDDTAEAKSGELYQEYRSYCMRTGDYPRSNADFIKKLGDQGYSRRKTRTGAFIHGLRIKESDFA